ncbi:unnamed protein product [Calypogeia fissa]
MGPTFFFMGMCALIMTWAVTSLGLPYDWWTYFIPCLSVFLLCDHQKLSREVVTELTKPFRGMAVVVAAVSSLYMGILPLTMVIPLVCILSLVRGFSFEKMMFIGDECGELAKFVWWRIILRWVPFRMNKMSWKGDWAYCSPYSRGPVHKSIESYYILSPKEPERAIIPGHFEFNFRIEECNVVCKYFVSGNNGRYSEIDSASRAEVPPIREEAMVWKDDQGASSSHSESGIVAEAASSDSENVMDLRRQKHVNKVQVTLSLQNGGEELESFTFFPSDLGRVAEIERAMKLLTVLLKFFLGDRKRLLYSFVSLIVPPGWVDGIYLKLQRRWPSLTFCNESYGRPYVQDCSIICKFIDEEGLPVLSEREELPPARNVSEHVGVSKYNLRNLYLDLEINNHHSEEGEDFVVKVCIKWKTDDVLFYSNRFVVQDPRKISNLIGMLIWLKENKWQGICKWWPEKTVMHAFPFKELICKTLDKDKYHEPVLFFLGEKFPCTEEPGSSERASDPSDKQFTVSPAVLTLRYYLKWFNGLGFGGVALSRVEAEMDSIMSAFHMVQKQLKSWKPLSSSVVSSLQIPGKILNDSVYEVCKPPRRPSIEIVFFHGLSLDGVDPHLRSWLSADGSELWPMGISKSPMLGYF